MAPQRLAARGWRASAVAEPGVDLMSSSEEFVAEPDGFPTDRERRLRRRVIGGCLIAPTLGASAVVTAFLLRTCAIGNQPVIAVALPFVMLGVFVVATMLAGVAYLLVCLIPARGAPVLGVAAALCAAYFVPRAMAFLTLAPYDFRAAQCSDSMSWW